MAQKKVNTRIQNKHDLEVNWLQATNFIPLPGELIVYDVEVDASGTTLALPSGRTTPYTYERFKIGDGINLVKDLPFVPNKTQAIYYIVGNGTTAGTWTGTHSDITEYYDGLTIAYKVNIAGASDLTLNINNLGAVSVVRNATSAVTTHYGVDSIIILVYSVDSSGTAYWKVADYDSDTKTRSSNKASTKMYIIGATAQSTSGQTTYSNSKVYIGTDNCLYSNGEKVAVAGHAHEVTTANAAPHTHTHNVTVSGTSGANSGSAVTVATGSVSSSGGGATIATGASGTATVLTGVKASGTKTVVTGISGGSGKLEVYSSEDDTEADASADSGRIPYVESISSTGASANGTATVLTGVKASGTDTFLKAISGGSGSLTSDTTATNGIKYVESISSTAASASSTAKAGSETHTHSYIKPTGVDLGSNTTSTNGIKYIEDVSHTAASLTGTKTFNTDAINSVTLSASTTSTDGPAYVESVSHTAASLTGTKTFNTDAIKSVTLSASDTSSDGPAYVYEISGGSGSLKSYDASSGGNVKTSSGRVPYIADVSHTAASLTGDTTFVKAQGTFNAGTTPVLSASPTHTSTNTGANSGTTVTALTGVKVSSTASAAPGGHTHSYDKTTSVTLTANDATATGRITYVQSISGSAPTLGGTKTFVTGITPGSGSLTSDTTATSGIPYVDTQGTLSHTSTNSESSSGTTGTIASYSDGVLTINTTVNSGSHYHKYDRASLSEPTIKYLQHSHISASASGTGTVTISGGSYSATTRYLSATPSQTSTNTGVNSGTNFNAATAVASNGTASVAPSGHTHTYDKTTGISLTRGTAPSLGAATTGTVGISGGSISKTIYYLAHTHTAASVKTTKYMKATCTAASTGTVGISGGSITPVTKYMKATGTAANTGTVGISGGSISKTTKYFHPSITTESTATGAPSATTSFVTGVTGGTTTATTKYLHHTHTGASANGTGSAVTGVASNGTAAVLTGVKGGTTTATIKYLHHTHTGASASGTTSAVTGVTSNGTTTAVTGLSTSKLVTTTAAPNSHTHSYGSSTALTTGNNSGTAVAAVTSVDESTD